jgi:hypothetical protein
MLPALVSIDMNGPLPPLATTSKCCGAARPVFVKQVVRRFHAASLISGTLISFSGLSQTGPAGCQFRFFPDQRCRFCAQTVTQRVARFANVSRSIPPCRALGVTKRIALCKCLSLYQSAKDFTQACASALLAKPLLGQFGRYLKVRNRAAHLWCWCAGIDQADNPSCIAQRD